MREPPFAQQINQIVTEYALDAEAQPETERFLVISLRCAPDDPTPQLRWDVVRRGPLADGARQHFERDLFKLRCPDCGITFDLMENTPACPLCGSPSVLVENVEGFDGKTAGTQAGV